MKTLKFTKFLKLTLALALLSTSSIFAQGFDDGAVPPPSPIDSNIYVAIVAGMLLISFFYYKTVSKKSKTI